MMPPADRPGGAIRASGAIRVTEAMLSELADGATEGLLAFDGDLRCLYANRTVEAWLGGDAGACIGRSVDEAFPFLVPSHLRMTLDGRSINPTGDTFAIPGTFAEQAFQARYFPLHGPGGEVIGVGVALRDVTFGQQAEQKLAETEDRFRNMANASPVLLWMARADGLCTFFNQTWLDFTGRTLEEEWGVGWAESVHFEEFESCMNTYVRAFNTRVGFEMEYRLRRADGEFRWILDRGIPRYTPEGAFAGYIGSCVDITERRGLEAHLRNSVRLRDEFLSIASHELGTPLTSLRLMVEALKRSVVNKKPNHEQAARLLETRVGTIEEQVLRLSGLVETLLDVSSIAQGRFSLSPEPVDLSELVRRVVARLAPVALDAGCAVALQTPGPVPGIWDRARTEQVISNLLSNALKYGAGRPVDVAVAVDDRLAHVSITDRGIGIAAEKQSVIFERFERAAPRTQYGGFGLGLWISRRALEEMGGAIRVHSREGAGARFEIDLPRAPQR